MEDVVAVAKASCLVVYHLSARVASYIVVIRFIRASTLSALSSSSSWICPIIGQDLSHCGFNFPFCIKDFWILLMNIIEVFA